VTGLTRLGRGPPVSPPRSPEGRSMANESRRVNSRTERKPENNRPPTRKKGASVNPWIVAGENAGNAGHVNKRGLRDGTIRLRLIYRESPLLAGMQRRGVPPVSISLRALSLICQNSRALSPARDPGGRGGSGRLNPCRKKERDEKRKE